jgi:hypothetical protein
MAELRHAGRELKVCGEVLEIAEQVAVGLDQYFRENPGVARYFGVRLDDRRHPIPEDLVKVAKDRVLVRLHPLD